MLTRRGRMQKDIRGNGCRNPPLLDKNLARDPTGSPKIFFALRATITKKNNLAFPPKISSHFARGYQKHQLTLENPEDFLCDQFTLRNSQKSVFSWHIKMPTRAGLPFKILDKTFFTQSREEYFRVIEARKRSSLLIRRGLDFCFLWKTARMSLVSLITTNSMPRGCSYRS